jgi:hypothetical protein
LLDPIVELLFAQLLHRVAAGAPEDHGWVLRFDGLHDFHSARIAALLARHKPKKKIAHAKPQSAAEALAEPS